MRNGMVIDWLVVSKLKKVTLLYHVPHAWRWEKLFICRVFTEKRIRSCCVVFGSVATALNMLWISGNWHDSVIKVISSEESFVFSIQKPHNFTRSRRLFECVIEIAWFQIVFLLNECTIKHLHPIIYYFFRLFIFIFSSKMH